MEKGKPCLQERRELPAATPDCESVNLSARLARISKSILPAKSEHLPSGESRRQESDAAAPSVKDARSVQTCSNIDGVGIVGNNVYGGSINSTDLIMSFLETIRAKDGIIEQLLKKGWLL